VTSIRFNQTQRLAAPVPTLMLKRIGAPRLLPIVVFHPAGYLHIQHSQEIAFRVVNLATEDQIVEVLARCRDPQEIDGR